MTFGAEGYQPSHSWMECCSKGPPCGGRWGRIEIQRHGGKNTRFQRKSQPIRPGYPGGGEKGVWDPLSEENVRGERPEPPSHPPCLDCLKRKLREWGHPTPTTPRVWTPSHTSQIMPPPKMFPWAGWPGRAMGQLPGDHDACSMMHGASQSLMSTGWGQLHMKGQLPRGSWLPPGGSPTPSMKLKPDRPRSTQFGRNSQYRKGVAFS